MRKYVSPTHRTQHAIHYIETLVVNKACTCNGITSIHEGQELPYSIFLHFNLLVSSDCTVLFIPLSSPLHCQCRDTRGWQVYACVEDNPRELWCASIRITFAVVMWLPLLLQRPYCLTVLTRIRAGRYFIGTPPLHISQPEQTLTDSFYGWSCSSRRHQHSLVRYSACHTTCTCILYVHVYKELYTHLILHMYTCYVYSRFGRRFLHRRKVLQSTGEWKVSMTVPTTVSAPEI